MPELDPAKEDATRRFLLQDRSRCPECSSPEIHVKTVRTPLSERPEVAWARCLQCGLTIETDFALELPPWAIRRPPPRPR